MLIVENEHFLTQLERIIAELRSGRHVILTHKGTQVEELIPLPPNRADRFQLIEATVVANRAKRWLDDKDTLPAYDFEGVIAVVKRLTTLSRIARQLLIIERFLYWDMPASFFLIQQLRHQAPTEGLLSA